MALLFFSLSRFNITFEIRFLCVVCVCVCVLCSFFQQQATNKNAMAWHSIRKRFVLTTPFSTVFSLPLSLCLSLSLSPSPSVHFSLCVSCLTFSWWKCEWCNCFDLCNDKMCVDCRCVVARTHFSMLEICVCFFFAALRLSTTHTARPSDLQWNSVSNFNFIWSIEWTRSLVYPNVCVGLSVVCLFACFFFFRVCVCFFARLLIRNMMLDLIQLVLPKVWHCTHTHEANRPKKKNGLSISMCFAYRVLLKINFFFHCCHLFQLQYFRIRTHCTLSKS